MKLQENYPLICPACGMIQHAEPSISMKLGNNTAHGNCTHCKEFLHIIISDNCEYMDAELWADYIERISLTPDDVLYFEELQKSA
jgi:hypothetical protein